MNNVKERIDIIITAWKEPDTIRKQINTIEPQIKKIHDYEFRIFVVCPDKETADAAISMDELGLVKWIQDPGKGKPLALNIVFRECISSNYLILTDGDVLIGVDSIPKLLPILVSNNTGCVSGHPVPSNSRSSILGYWAHLLTEAGAHRKRLSQQQDGKMIVASGYLMGLKTGIIKSLPEDILVDDAYISHAVVDAGYKVTYAPDAIVYVKFPTSFSDWMKQKKRSAGGYIQLYQKIGKRKDSMRNFGKEAWGIFDALSYPRNIIEFIWTILLIFARLYLWLSIVFERVFSRKTFEKTWVRIESTK